MAEVALPIAGLMADEPVETMALEFENFERVVIQELGCQIQPHPLYDMNFICLPNIPHLGITDKGLINSDTMEIMPVVTGPWTRHGKRPSLAGGEKFLWRGR